MSSVLPRATLHALAAVSALTAASATAAVQSQRLCPDLEPRPGRRAPEVCYAGVPCVVGVRGEGLEFVVSASAVSADGAVVTGGRLLSVGGNGIPPSAHCVPAAGGAFVSVRLPAIEQPGAYTLVMQRSPLFGIGRSDEKATLHVIASHGFLNPRQAESSEGARMGEERTFTLAGRQLGGLRVRSGAAALQGAGAPITDVQWMSPDQSQVRIRLTLHRVGLVPLSELFEFIGSGESPVNRDLGWPVIDVLP